MNIKTLILPFLLIFVSCDTITVDYRVGRCMEHNWAYKGIYKVEKREGMKVSMKNMSGGDDITVSTIDKGWNTVECPQGK